MMKVIFNYYDIKPNFMSDPQQREEENEAIAHRFHMNVFCSLGLGSGYYRFG
jgi:hypothetical protein